MYTAISRAVYTFSWDRPCHSETMEKMVVYQALYGERGWWVRPADMWLEKVEHDGQILSRFTYIAPDEATARALLNEK